MPGPSCQSAKSTPSLALAARQTPPPPASSKPPSSSFMCGLLLRMEHFNDWDLQAVVRSCSFSHPAGPPPEPQEPAGPPPRGEAEAPAEAPLARELGAVAAKGASLYDLEYLDLDHKPFLLSPPSQQARAPGDDGHEVMISFPAAAAAASTTSGMQPRMPAGRKPTSIRTPRPKRSKKSQLKKVVCEVPVADGGVSSDPWAWRKYGQKPIKGSPYPRGYYKCSSMKGCMARKMVERSPAKPGVLIVTYMAEHCHPVPTQLNALAGTTRQKSAAAAAEDHPTTSPRSHEGPVGGAGGSAGGAARCEDDSNETSSALAMDGGTEAAVYDENEFWPAEMGLDEFLAPVDDDFDHVFEEGGALGRRLSL